MDREVEAVRICAKGNDEIRDALGRPIVHWYTTANVKLGRVSQQIVFNIITKPDVGNEAALTYAILVN